MANQTKTTQEKTVKTTKDDVAELKQKLLEQQEQIEKLMQALLNNQQDDSQFNRLNILGEAGSVLISFDKMYEEQLIDYASLKDALRNRTNREMAKKGRFYINDERVVTKLRLKNDYKNILTPEQLKHILSSDVNKAIELYKLAPIGQKSTIVEIVKQSKFNGEDIDYNLLRELTKLSGVDLVNIEDVTKIEIKE